MSLILAVDTSAKPVSCALAEDGKVLASSFANNGLTHSQTLMSMVDNLLKIANKTAQDLDAVAVNAGPGSFTGVRIGVSSVKGIAFTDNLPCVLVSTLASMAENVASCPHTILCCLMDARCQQVYGALFERDAEGNLLRICPDSALTIDEMGEKLLSLLRTSQYVSHAIVLVGDGSEMCYRVWKERIPNLYLAPASVRYQNAAATAVLACQELNAGHYVSAEELQPIYLRLPQAERELNARMNEK